MDSNSDNIRIYLKESDVPHLAKKRIRIIKEVNPREPCANFVFEKVGDESLIPANAIFKWKFDCNNGHEPIWSFTTAERCKEMVSEDPSCWTQEKLQQFADEEKKLYQAWCDGHVYGFICEKWVNKRRHWEAIDHAYGGMYGAEDLMYNLKDFLEFKDSDDGSLPVCIDSEEMKYEFDNCEKTVNEFSNADEASCQE